MQPGRIVVIGERDAVLGLGLIGLEGRHVTTLVDATQTLERYLTDPGVALILLTEDWADQLRALIDRHVARESGAMVVEVPASRPVAQPDTLLERLERILGLHLGGER